MTEDLRPMAVQYKTNCVYDNCRWRPRCEASGEAVCLNHPWAFTAEDIRMHIETCRDWIKKHG